jgi:hypothetical protein
MTATLTVRDETTSSLDEDHVFLLDLPSERVTVEQLIRTRVRSEVEDYNASTSEHFRGLIQPSDAETTLNGFKIGKERRIDPDEQCGKAVEAVGRNGFILLVDDRQAEKLDEEIEVRPETTVTFLKARSADRGLNHAGLVAKHGAKEERRSTGTLRAPAG